MISTTAVIPDDRSTVVLRSGELTLELAPLIGGSISRFYSVRDGAQFHWLRPATDEALSMREPEAMASSPLIPFCNRIRNGRAEFQGRELVLPPNRGNSPHAIHGMAWKRQWSVVERDARSARLELDYPRDDWPYHFRATQEFEVRDDHLTVHIAVENLDSRTMPVGIGHHPYLPHRPNTRLTVSLSQMWQGDAEVMPTGLETPPLLERLRAGTCLRDVVQDNNFIGWNRFARVDWPATTDHPFDAALTMTAESPLDFFVLYSPADEDFFCIEPVSNCTDWLNLGEYSIRQRGGAVIAPGEVYRASFTLVPQWGDTVRS